MIRPLLLAMAAAGQAPVDYHLTSLGDPHLQSIRFQQDRVVVLVGYLGYQTVIEFAPGERIENVGIGDATGWQVSPNKRADLLFVKPVGRGPATNMVVVTNQRTYAFALSVAPANASTATAAWTLRFVLPPEPQAAPVLSPPVTKNRDYTIEGPESLMPIAVFDDGKRTYFTWPDEAALPAIFAVNPDGSEALVNFIVQDDQVVVQQIAGRFLLRRGDAISTVTSTPGTARRLPLAKGRLKP